MRRGEAEGVQGAGILRCDHHCALVVQVLRASGKRRKSVLVFESKQGERKLRYKKG